MLTQPRSLIVISPGVQPITGNLPDEQAPGTTQTALALPTYKSPITIKPISWKITHNAHGVLDTAEIVIPIQGNPDLANLVPAGASLPIQITAGFPSNPVPGGYTYRQLNSRFIGTIDQTNPSFDIDAQTATITCTSNGAVLTRNKTTTMLGSTNYNGIGV